MPYSAQYPNRVKGVLPDGCGPQCASIYGPRPGSCAYPIPDLSALGQFNMEGSWGSSDLVKTRSWVIKKGEWDPKKKEFPTILGFNLEEWVMGCGLKEISIDAQCSNYVTCRGFCHGTTTKLCQSQNNLVCGLEVEMDITQFAGPAVGFLVDLFSIEAAISATLSYTARGGACLSHYWPIVHHSAIILGAVCDSTSPPFLTSQPHFLTSHGGLLLLPQTHDMSLLKH